MSAVCVLTPVLIGCTWPLIQSIVVGVAASMGFAVAKGAAAERTREEAATRTKVEVDVPNSEVVDEMRHNESIVIERGDLRIEFRRDERGICRVCVDGVGSKRQLEKIGQEVAGRVVQQFAYHKLMTELKNRNYQVVEEQVQQGDAIHLRVRYTR